MARSEEDTEFKLEELQRQLDLCKAEIDRIKAAISMVPGIAGSWLCVNQALHPELKHPHWIIGY